MSNQNIRSLTGIRLIGALWIVVFHYSDILTDLIPSISPLKPIFSQGHYAVSLFFILSGYILSHSYFDRYKLSQHLSFLWLRFSRLWPVHFMAIILLLAYVGIARLLNIDLGPTAFPLSQLPIEIFMIRSWFAEQSVWNYPAWSIHVEWFAYIFLFPLCVWIFKKKQSTLLTGIILLLLLITHSIAIHYSIPGRILDILFLFIAGSALYCIRSTASCPQPKQLVNVGVLLIVLSLITQSVINDFVLILAFTLIIWGLTYNQGWLNRFLSHDWVVYGGKLSYALYMTHTLIQNLYYRFALRVLTYNAGVRLFIAIGLMATVIATACVFYHGIEEPMNRKLRGVFSTQ